MMQQRFNRSAGVLALLMLLGSFSIFAQTNLTQLRVSPHASVSQTIGFTEITIDYHRPAVNNRQVWGGLVPYGMAPGQPFNFNKPFPWRAGANENTTITFSTDVTVNGAQIPAGKYGLHMLPVENGEWTIIFNKDNASWGSFFYDEKQDQARVKTKPVSAPFSEWLYYGFENLSQNSAVGYLHWAELKVPFTVEIDLHETVLASYREQLTNLAGFNWQAWMQAANYCAQNKINQAEGLVWIENSVARNRDVRNLAIKAVLLEQTGKSAESKKVEKETLELAKNTDIEADLNTAGYNFLFNNKTEQAIEIFKLNIKKHPDSWNVYDSLAEAYQQQGNTSESIKLYQKAMAMAPDGQKNRIQNAINSQMN